jgi:hypothetical protein
MAALVRRYVACGADPRLAENARSCSAAMLTRFDYHVDGRGGDDGESSAEPSGGGGGGGTPRRVVVLRPGGGKGQMH